MRHAEAGEGGISPIAPKPDNAIYQWESIPVGSTAQLLTLICRSCERPVDGPAADIPLVSVLRDTLGDDRPENDRLTSIWLLTFGRPTIGKRLLSAVPFFYWRAGPNSNVIGKTPPLLDLTSPEHAVFGEAGRDLVQWTILNSLALPVRATSHAYRSNEIDDERLHLGEAIAYLQEAPFSSDSSALTEGQIRFVIARLQLRKMRLGGLVNQKDASRMGEDEALKAQEIRSRNWELLRQCAEKTNLYFEALDLAGDKQQFAMLWLPLGEGDKPAGTELSSVWKLLGINDPRKNLHQEMRNQTSYMRDTDENGKLVPFRQGGMGQSRLLPVAVYSLTYSRQPLLLIDLQNVARVRRHEVLQRSVNEITTGVIGISVLANWYYFVAADLYDFVAARRGSVMDQSARLDCYSQFRVKLALDNHLDATLRRDLQKRFDVLATNPLESTPQQETSMARLRYRKLETEIAPGAALARNVEKDRRAELARYTEPRKTMVKQSAFHELSLGIYTHRVKADAGNLDQVDKNRRFEYQLTLLEQIAKGGGQPEVSYDNLRIQQSLAELSELSPAISSRKMRGRAAAVTTQLSSSSRDETLRTACATTMTSLRRDEVRTGVLARPVVIKTPRLAHSAGAIRIEALRTETLK